MTCLSTCLPSDKPSMAISLSNTAFSFTKPTHSILQTLKHSPRYDLGFCLATKTRNISLCSIKENESSSSTVTELEKETPTVEMAEEKQEVVTIKKQPNRHVADRWRELHGEHGWSGLLDPMDPLLRAEITRYGEMAQATYDSFIVDPAVRYYANCKFPPHEFFEGLEMEEEEHGYQVTRYLFVSSNVKLPKFFLKSRWPQEWSENATWIGYVAVSSDETSKRLGRRDIAIVWRGTQTKVEWIEDLKSFLKPVSSAKIPSPDQNTEVEAGFLDLYTSKDVNCKFCKYSGREMILTEIKRLAEMYPNDELSITTTGHSLGAALALLSAYDIAETGLNLIDDNRSIPISAITFSGPRVGNVNFMKRIEALGVKVLRVVNVHDIVPKAPGMIFSDMMPRWMQTLSEEFPWSFVHVGVELTLDHKKSPFLKDSPDVGNAHNLEGILHVLDGYHGKGGEFELATGRDLALVNKSCDFLKDDCRVPPTWKQDQNKGMVRNEEGRWVQPERPGMPDHQIHPHDIQDHLKHLGLS